MNIVHVAYIYTEFENEREKKHTTESAINVPTRSSYTYIGAKAGVNRTRTCTYYLVLSQQQLASEMQKSRCELEIIQKPIFKR